MRNGASLAPPLWTDKLPTEKTSSFEALASAGSNWAPRFTFLLQAYFEICAVATLGDQGISRKLPEKGRHRAKPISAKRRLVSHVCKSHAEFSLCFVLSYMTTGYAVHGIIIKYFAYHASIDMSMCSAIMPEAIDETKFVPDTVKMTHCVISCLAQRK